MQGSLAEKLRVLRARVGLSLTEAASRAGVTRDTLSDIEHGKRHPYMPTLSKIAAGYGVPVEDLLEEPALAGASPGKAEASKTGPETVTGSMHAEVDEETFKALVWALTGQILDDLEDEAYEEATGKVRKMRELLFAS